VTASGQSATRVLTRPRAAVLGEPRSAGRRLLIWGGIALAISIPVYVAGWAAGWPQLTPNTIDLQVYIDGGMIVRHIAPVYDPHLASPLYDWQNLEGLNFTYTPFAAVAFAVVSFVPWSVLTQLTVIVNVLALAGACWLALGSLGYSGRVRTGAALLATAGTFWLEPVQRTVFFGQVNLVLMLLVLLDLCLPDQVAGKWWKGTGIGIAAGIKLVPLVFIPYLLLTRRFREAAVATGVFCATIALGFVALPRDSVTWWVKGLFMQSGRTGFPGVLQNQSLHGVLTRFAGSVHAGTPIWLAAAVIVGVVGVLTAAVLHRAGEPMLGILTCALTGLLVSPISWDHHWVWIAPGFIVMGHFAVRAWRAGQRRAATALWVLNVVVWGAFAAWPIAPLMPKAETAGAVGLDGLLWLVPSTPETLYSQVGDRPWLTEYHWRGLSLIGGNLYVLVGLGLLALLIVTAVRMTRQARGPDVSSGRAAGGTGVVVGADAVGEPGA
jgi:alpha-1,2-mannosyltransferase